MKEEEQLIKWIEKMYHKYKGVLFIEKYNLKIKKDEDKDPVYLSSKFNHPYLDITILYSAEFLKDWKKDKKDAERRIIHEFCHTITDSFYNVVVKFPTKQDIENERETLTDHIAQIVNKHLTKLSK